MFLKRISVLIVLVIIALVLNGCGLGSIVYEKQTRPVSEVEEILADKIEIENPNLDVNVTITQNQD